MKNAIRTRFLSCTDTKGSRMRASCEARSVTVSYDHALNSDENHAAAKDALVKKIGYAAWDRHSTDPVMIGGTYGGDTYWVFDPNRGKRAQY